MECFESHLADIILAIFWAFFSLIFAARIFLLNRDFSCVLHSVLLAIVCVKTLMLLYLVTCIIEELSDLLLWVSFFINLSIFLANFVGSVSVFYFISLGLGFSFMEERGSYEYSVIYVFVPGYVSGILLFAYPHAGMICSCGYFWFLYIVIRKNVAKTCLHLYQNFREYTERQVKLLEYFKTLVFWYCQVSSFFYLGMTVSYYTGRSFGAVRIVYQIIEAVLIAFITWLFRPQNIFTESLLYPRLKESSQIRMLEAYLDSSYTDMSNQDVVIMSLDYSVSYGQLI